MEEILKKLLQSDSAMIKEGTKELREALKSSEAIPSLCQVMVSAKEPQIRQYGAVILRKRFSKSRHWSGMNIDIRNQVKTVLMQALINEQEKSVKNSIAQLIGTIAKHELPSTSWPELLQFLQHTTTSNSTNDKELGFYTLSILTDVAGSQFHSHAGSFIILFSNTLANLNDPASPIAFFIILSMMHFGPAVRTNPELSKMYVDMFPRVLNSIKALAAKRPDRATEAMDFLYDLAEKEGMAILTPRIKPVIQMCLEFVENKACTESLQLKALNFVCIFVGSKMKVLEKNNLVVPILNVLFRVMSQHPEDDEEEEYFASDEEEETLLTSASETLDTMAMFMDPEDLMPPIMQFIQPALMSNDVYTKKSAYISIGILAQGCESYIRKNSMSDFVEVIYKGIMDEQPVVRNAALFALGQFAEHLQPEISLFSKELMPVMVALIDQIVQKGKMPAKLGNTVDRMFYACEKFCENLEDSLIPYLPELISKLLVLFEPEYSIHIRELSISTLGAVASSAKEALVPFFQEIMSKLNVYLTQPQEAETICLQVEAIDTLAALARNIGEENFKPLAGDSIQLGLQLISSTDDPDIRKSSYGLFASVSSILKEGMAPVLPTVIDFIMKSIQNKEGFMSHLKDDEDNAFPVYDSESLDEDEDLENDEEDNDDMTEFNVENDFIEEKEESCFALKELAANTGEAFIPYLQSCFEEVFKLLSFPNGDVRRAAVEAEFQLCINVSCIETPEGQRGFQEALERLIAKSSLLIRVDEDRDVVLSLLECYQMALKEIGQKIVVIPSVLDAIISCIKDVVTNRTEVQGSVIVEELEGLEEADEDLIDAASDLIPALGRAMPHEEFASHFAILLPLFKDRLYSTSDDDAAKSNSIGMLAECMEGLGEYVTPHLNTLVPYLLCLTKDSSLNIRNNAIYAIGEMALHGKEAVYPHYPEILTALARTLPTEKSGKVLDNICGAISRLIIANTNGVPIDQVLPVLVNNIPLREDFVEDKWVFGCLTHLYTLGNQILLQHLVPIIKVAGHTLHQHNPDKETKEVVVNFVKMCHRDFPEDCRTAANQLPQDTVSVLQQACTN